MLCSPYVSELLDGCGLSLRNSLTRATHVAGAALDLVFCSGGVSAECFTVHQGDDCCLMSPSCCPALGSDHFLCDLQLSIMDHQEAHGTHVDGVHGAHSDFPRVQDLEPVLLAARTRLDEWAATVQNCSMLNGGLPMRCAKVSALFDDLVGILWETASSLHPRPSSFPRQRRQPRWWTDDCFQAMEARNASWRDYRRSNSCEDYARFSIPSSPLPQAGSFYSASFLEMLARRGRPVAHPGPPSLRKPHSQMLPSANDPTTCHMARCNGVPRSSTTRRPGDGWRAHFFFGEHLQHTRRLLRRLLLVND